MGGRAVLASTCPAASGTGGPKRILLDGDAELGVSAPTVLALVSGVTLERSRDREDRPRRSSGSGRRAHAHAHHVIAKGGDLKDATFQSEVQFLWEPGKRLPGPGGRTLVSAGFPRQF